MEVKFAAEMEEHKVRLDKEYDTVKQNFVTEIDKLRKKQAAEIEKKVSYSWFYLITHRWNKMNLVYCNKSELHSNFTMPKYCKQTVKRKLGE